MQKDPEASLTWRLKDELVERSRVYYAKLARGRATFLAARMVPYFHAVWGLRRSEEKQRLSEHAQILLRVLRREWELSTRGPARRIGCQGPNVVHSSDG